ncbi:MAG: hypothetical protein KAX80_01720 [Planctomycetes bacterium]|nr:hypothetical protein [Planctomycetota bacterium]
MGKVLVTGATGRRGESVVETEMRDRVNSVCSFGGAASLGCPAGRSE